MELGAIIGISAGVFLLGLAIYFILWQKKMFNPLPTGQISVEDPQLQFYAIKEQSVNFFIITDGLEYIMIDCGYGKSSLISDMEKLKLDPKKISDIFITHADLDHIGGRSFFPNAIFHLHEKDMQIIDGTTHRFKNFYKYPKVKHPFELFSDGENFEVGQMHVKAIATPGHTPGSSSFLLNNCYLFTGDTLTLHNGEVHTFYKFITMDMDSQKASIRKLAHLENIRYLFSAHTQFTADFGRAMQNWK
ncbi:MBL fold metallo-hydrolase [Candidatus Lokiarchaeum ossiferum]|uniref:MBL fold metallo-hydrolase n=1 Tax=Candidatus Lokiarchaeum ossiferum TaxID=2951803 RepID=UPI00352CF80B